MNPYQYAQAVLAAATCQWAMAQAPTAANTPAPPAASIATTPAAAKAPADENPGSEPRIIRGNDKVIAPAAPAAALSGSASAFNFEETPVADVVRIVLGDILKADYVLHPPLAGTVTLATREAVSPDQALYLLESALQASGLVLVRDARGAYHVGRPEALKGIGSNSRQVVSGGNLPAGFGVIIVPLQFIGANEMATILRPLMQPDALVRADTVRNLLVLVGTRSQADGWLDLVRTFDVDLLKGMSVGVFPLKYASVKEVEAALRLMSPGGVATPPPTGAAAATTARPQTGTTGAATTAASLADSNPLHGALRIMPIERLNSILVVTPRAAYLDEARLWIERLDKPSDNTAEPQLFVYPVQNGSAQHLAEVLNGIFGNSTSSTSSTTGVAPRLGSATANSNQPFGNTMGTGGFGNNNNSGFFTSGGATVLGAPSNTSNRNGNANAAGTSSGSGAVALNQNVRVMADDRNNAVLIYGTRAEYSRIESALKRLDSPPTQVLIEASIIEVTLTDELKYGVQWMFSDSFHNGYRGGGVITGRDDAGLGGVNTGFSYTLRNPLGNLRAVLNALDKKTKLNVIASPSLMVLDNHTANISSGTQQPINAGTTVVTGGITTTNIQYKDTGVALAVTPSVNAGDMVTMEINQSMTDVGAPDTGLASGNTGQVTFVQRQLSSKVAVRSGETLVLGGLIREKNTAGAAGVPGLHDIPLLGALFGTKSKNLERTELLVVITPRVIRSDQNMREVSQELRDRMRGLSDGLQDGRGLKLLPPSPGRAGSPQEN